MNVCPTHNVEKRLYGKIRPRWRCHKCAAEQVARSRAKFIARLKEERGNCCQDCGYDVQTLILQFHHRDPSTKTRAVGNVSNSHHIMRSEAEKCDLLCPNCHAIRHLAD